MRKLIYSSDCSVQDKLKRQYDVFITLLDSKNDHAIPRENYYTPVKFATYIRTVRHYGSGFSFDLQDEFEYIINLVCDFVGSINLVAKHNMVFDFSPLEKCTELVAT